MTSEKSYSGDITKEDHGTIDPAENVRSVGVIDPVQIDLRAEVLALAEKVGLWQAAKHHGVTYRQAQNWRADAIAARLTGQTASAERKRRARDKAAGREHAPGPRKRGRPKKTGQVAERLAKVEPPAGRVAVPKPSPKPRPVVMPPEVAAVAQAAGLQARPISEEQAQALLGGTKLGQAIEATLARIIRDAPSAKYSEVVEAFALVSEKAQLLTMLGIHYDALIAGHARQVASTSGSVSPDPARLPAAGERVADAEFVDEPKPEDEP